jgi:hypothetical protein
MKRMNIKMGLVSVMAISTLGAQAVTSTSDWEWKRSHPSGLAQGGPMGIQGGVGWNHDGSRGVGGVERLFTPNEQSWGEDYLDAPKALARMQHIENKGFEFEYITMSGQSIRSGCRVVNTGTSSGPLYWFLDHYEPGKGYRIFRNGILIHQEFFDPQPVPPRIDFKETGPDQVEWWIQRTPKLENYQVRVSWDGGESWLSRGFKDNHVVLALEEPRRKPGVQPWIEFQIAQGFVVTTNRYVMGKGFTSK